MRLGLGLGLGLNNGGKSILIPVISDVVVSSTTDTTADFTLNVNPGNGSTLVWMSYGETISYGLSKSLGTFSGSVVVNITSTLTALDPYTTYHFKIYASNDAGTVSTDDSTFDTLEPTILSDSNTLLRYKPSDSNWVLPFAGKQAAYYNIIDGKDQRGPELNNGLTIRYAVYEITACEADHFFTGNQVGDIFCAPINKEINANNRLKRVLGNHIGQFDTTKMPIDGVFDGISQFMSTPAMTLNHPTTVYMLCKQKTWQANGSIFDGASYSCGIRQFGSSPNIRAFAGAFSGPFGYFPLDTWGALMVVFNGANSSIQVNESALVEGNFGTTTYDGFMLAMGGSGVAGNIEVDEVIVRSIADSPEDKAVIYNYLKKKNNLTNYYNPMLMEDSIQMNDELIMNDE